MANRKYVSPEICVVRYAADRAFATGCTSQDSSYYGYDAQTVYCIVAGSHTIFESGTDGCENVVDLSGSGEYWYFAEYNGVKYFVWYDGGVESIPNSTQETILAGLGIESPGWHAATYSSTFYQLLTASY